MSPAELLGLARPDLVEDVARHRWALLLLAVAWALFASLGRKRVALAFGCGWAIAASLFWVLALGRPFGLLLDSQVTRMAARIAVAEASDRATEGAIAGEPVEPTLAARLAARGVPSRVLVEAPSFAPVLVTPLLALAVALLVRTPAGFLAACLVLSQATGDLDALRGLGLVNGIWYRPEAAVLWPLLLTLALALARSRTGLSSSRLAVLGAAALVLLRSVRVAGGFGLPAPAPPPLPSGLSLSLGLSLDHGVWFGLGLLALLRFRRQGSSGPLDTAGAGLVLGGAIAALLAGLGAPLDAWTGAVGLRLGLLLLSANLLEAVLGSTAESLASTLAAWVRSLSSSIAFPLSGSGLLAGACVLLLAPGSFLAWWDPEKLDPRMRYSLEPVSTRAAEAAGWLRTETPADAVVLAGPAYAGEVAVFGGRRLLRAPALATPDDDERRLRAQKAALTGRPAEALFQRYGLRFVFAGPGDFRDHGLGRPEDLDAVPGLRLRHSAAGGFRIYELVSPGSASENAVQLLR